MLRSLRVLVPAALLWLSGCEFDDLTRFGGGGEVAEARLFTATGEELTPRVELPLARRLRVEVRLFDAAGNRLTDLEERYVVRLDWGASGFAFVDEVPGEALAREITVVDPCVSPELRIGFGRRPYADEGTSGPFPVVVRPEAVSVRLTGPGGEPLPAEAPLPTGEKYRVQVEVLDCEGQPIRSGLEGFDTELYWSSGDFAHVDSVPGQPFAHDVIALRPCSQGQVSIGLRPSGGRDVRVFGPLAVIGTVQGPAFARLFDAEGNELTPEVQLPSGRRTRIEARFFGCAGERLTGLENGNEMQFFWSSGDFAHVDPVPGQPFQKDVIVLQPPGTRGQMAVGFGRPPFPHDRVLGPYPVVVR